MRRCALYNDRSVLTSAHDVPGMSHIETDHEEKANVHRMEGV